MVFVAPEIAAKQGFGLLIPPLTLIRINRLMYTGTASQRHHLLWYLVEIESKLPIMRGKLVGPKPPVNTGSEPRFPNVTVVIIRDVFCYVTPTFVCAQN